MRPVRLYIASVLLMACARPNAEAASGDAPAGSGDLASSIEVEVSADSVRFGLHVTNTSDDPVEFTFPSSQRYDFTVEGPSGATVWRWSDGRMFTQAIARVTLEPAESWDLGASWDPGERSGRFVVTGVLTARDGVRQQAAFDLP